MDWAYFLNNAREGFYTEFVMQSIDLLVIILYFSLKRKTKSLRYLAIIAIASFIEELISDYNILTRPLRMGTGAVMIIYIFIELICCLLFIKAHIQSRIAKKIMLFSPIVLIGFIIIRAIIYLIGLYPVNQVQANSSTPRINFLVIEGGLIIISSLYFFYELLIRDPSKIRINTPAIWAISGMLILSGTLAPFSLFGTYMYQKNKPLMHNLWPINYIAYSLLFITFAIAIISDKRTSGSNA